MSTNPKGRALIMRGEPGPAGAAQRLKELGVQLPAPLSHSAPTWKRYSRAICFF
jgi:hypothetical protein